MLRPLALEYNPARCKHLKFCLPFASVPSDSIAGQWSRVVPSLLF
nr:MAG TPA_asm: hypothetical protein [Caudoviricetes sp.]